MREADRGTLGVAGKPGEACRDLSAPPRGDSSSDAIAHRCGRAPDNLVTLATKSGSVLGGARVLARMFFTTSRHAIVATMAVTIGPAFELVLLVIASSVAVEGLLWLWAYRQPNFVSLKADLRRSVDELRIPCSHPSIFRRNTFLGAGPGGEAGEKAREPKKLDTAVWKEEQEGRQAGAASEGASDPSPGHPEAQADRSGKCKSWCPQCMRLSRLRHSQPHCVAPQMGASLFFLFRQLSRR